MNVQKSEYNVNFDSRAHMIVSSPPSLCTVDESGSGQPEGMDMVVCRAPGGEFYVEGETWNLDECTRCTCRKGRVLCDTEVCPPALCQTPIRNKDTCCHICPGKIKNSQPFFFFFSMNEGVQSF